MSNKHLLLFQKQGLIAAAEINDRHGGFLYEGRLYRLDDRSAGEFNHWLKEGSILVGFHLFQTSILCEDILASPLIANSENVFVENEDIHILLGGGSFENLENDSAQLLWVSVYSSGPNDHLVAIPLLRHVSNQQLWQKIGFSLQTERIPLRVPDSSSLSSMRLQEQSLYGVASST